jgi:hypothetical protein
MRFRQTLTITITPVVVAGLVLFACDGNSPDAGTEIAPASVENPAPADEPIRPANGPRPY